MTASSQQLDHDQLTLRLATGDDAPRVVQLAALDSARPPRGAVLLAEVAGELWAAVSLGDLRSVADPFRHTAAVRELAVLRARQLRDAPGGSPAGAQATHRQVANWLAKNASSPALTSSAG